MGARDQWNAQYFRWDVCARGAKHGGRRWHSDDASLAHIRVIHEQLRGEYGWPRMHRELLARGACARARNGCAG